MAIVTVYPSDMPPVKFEGRVWVRTGPRRSIASAQEERILNEKRRYKSIPFDICPIPTAKISNLSKSIFENEYLPNAFSDYDPEQDERSYAEKLASCKMIFSPEDTTPTLLGLLSIGISPQDFLPGAFIQFLRIDGTELADPVIDEEAITGGITEMLRRAEEKLKSHNRIAVEIASSATHQIEIPYPQAALQQILYNALFHRTYEGTNTPVRIYWFNDRIEIISPGGPYGNVTVDNFATPGITDYRNPNIAGILKTFGFVQAFGRGIATARRHMRDNGNPELEFEVNHSAVVCILREKNDHTNIDIF
jgi:ATP-dependent DNA helicase RecG